MSLDGRFHRLGERKRELHVLDDNCINLACWDPQPVISRGRTLMVCERRLYPGCPDEKDRSLATTAERERRKREWVKS